MRWKVCWKLETETTCICNHMHTRYATRLRDAYTICVMEKRTKVKDQGQLPRYLLCSDRKFGNDSHSLQRKEERLKLSRNSCSLFDFELKCARKRASAAACVDAEENNELRSWCESSFLQLFCAHSLEFEICILALSVFKVKAPKSSFCQVFARIIGH